LQRDDVRLMTVDQLARRGGTTTRHVRALQTRGLLPHPHLVGRTGYYDAEHLDRLRAVLRLQRRGFSLSAIDHLVEAWGRGDSLGDVLGLPSRPDPHPGDDLSTEWAAFDEWSFARRTTPLSIVPTTVLSPLDAAS
jgi:DNA-binding transcriptional MerR regulator